MKTYIIFQCLIIQFHLITEFEIKNNVAVNVWKESKSNDSIVLYYAHKNKVNNIINLLLIKNDSEFHYIFIKRLNGLFKIGSHTSNICDRCFTSYSDNEKLKDHQEIP